VFVLWFGVVCCCFLCVFLFCVGAVFGGGVGLFVCFCGVCSSCVWFWFSYLCCSLVVFVLFCCVFLLVCRVFVGLELLAFFCYFVIGLGVFIVVGVGFYVCVLFIVFES